MSSRRNSLNTQSKVLANSSLIPFVTAVLTETDQSSLGAYQDLGVFAASLRKIKVISIFKPTKGDLKIVTTLRVTPQQFLALVRPKTKRLQKEDQTLTYTQRTTGSKETKEGRINVNRANEILLLNRVTSIAPTTSAGRLIGQIKKISRAFSLRRTHGVVQYKIIR